MKNLLMIRTITHHTRRTARLVAIALFAVLLSAAPFHAAFAQTAPALGSAASFAVLAGTAVTCIDSTDSTVTGDVGVWPGTAITQTNCTINGTVHAGDWVAKQAYNDFLSAYDALEALPVTSDQMLTGTLAGVTLTPGVYWFDAASTTTNGTLTLSGPSNGIWIFKIGTLGTGALTGTNFSVVMEGGGLPCNVYWWVAEAATMTDSAFQGTILAGADITITRGTFNGDALAQAAVTMTGFTAGTAAPTTPGASTGVGGLGVGPTPVDLGTAGNFVILAKSGITNVPTSIIIGDIGVSPITYAAITGFSLTPVVPDVTTVFSTSTQVTGKVYAADYTSPTPANLGTAVLDMQAAYTDAAGRAPDYTELGTGNIGGLTLTPGTYKWGTVVTIPTDVTLSGGPNDVWIFQIAGGLTQASATKVILTGGALAKNVFWQAAGVVALDTTAHFEGIVLSQTAITLKAGATANGRLLAQTNVTLISNTVTQPAP